MPGDQLMTKAGLRIWIGIGLILAALLASTIAYGADAPVLAYGLSAVIFIGAAIAKPTLPPRPRVAIAGVCGFALVGLSQWAGPGTAMAGPDMAVLASAAGVYLVAYRIGLEPAQLERLMGVVAWGLAIAATLAFLDHLADPATVFGRTKAYHGTRLTAAFLSANTAATFFAMLMVLGVGRALYAVRGADLSQAVDQLSREALGSTLLAVMAGVCLLLTGSRAGIAAAGIGILVLVIWGLRLRSGRAWGGLGLAVLLVCGVVAWVSRDVLWARVAAEGAGVTGRDVLWPASWSAWQNAPLFGHGFGSFPAAIRPVITAQTAPILVTQGAAHNLVLQWLVQAGVVGSLGGLLILGAAAEPIAVGLARRQRFRLHLKTGAVLIGVVLLHGAVDYALELPAIVWWFALFMGLAAGVGDGRSAGAGRVNKS